MNRMFMVIGTLFFCAQASFALAEESKVLTIAGTGDSQLLLRTLADDFNMANPESRVVIPNSIGSTGGVRALLADKILLARTARPLKEKEQGKGLIEHQFASSPIALVVHPSVVGVDSLTAAQVTGIYSGQYKHWSELGGPDAKIYPVDREAGDSSRRVLETHLPGFRGIKSRAKVFYSTLEAMQAIEKHSFTIGFLPLSVALGSELKVIQIDGVSPREYVDSKSDYPYIVTFYLVSRGEPKGLAAEFLRFLTVETTRRKMAAEGVKPVN